MTDTATTSPSGTVEQAPMSFDAGVDAIENLLSDDPEMDLEGAGEAQAKEGDSVQAQAEDDEPDLVLDDDDTDEAADVAADASSEPADGVIITLQGGEKISLGDLKRNNLYQRDYTRKTEELKQQREQLQQEFDKRASDAENDIRHRRDFILDNWKRFIPQEPDRAMMDERSEKFDPIGYLQAKQNYDDTVAEFNAMHSERVNEANTAAEKQKADAEEFAREEWGKFLASNKRLQDETKLKAFRDDVKSIGIEHYKLNAEEIKSVTDHRYMQVLADAIAYRKLVAKSQAAKQEITAKPKLRQQQRMSPQTVQSRDRQGRFENARQSGSLDAVARSIEDLI
ncbi:hypothetical protein [Ensifer adhaerens]|uniref:hypothetical protein n=1 Tax=Ensifer adhaerens TaxID=106592 RepID=UPI00131A2815|nr:hypothetical protein [Ensifer adhaerens]